MDIRNLIIRVLRGKASSREKLELDSWLSKRAPNNSNETDQLSASDATKDNEPGKVPDQTDLARIRQLAYLASRKSKTNRMRWISATVLVALSAAVFLVRMFDTQPVTLSFKDSPVSQVVDQIESMFSVSVIVEDKGILSCRFSGNLYHITTPEEILNALKAANNIQWRKSSPGKYIIKGPGCDG